MKSIKDWCNSCASPNDDLVCKACLLDIIERNSPKVGEPINWHLFKRN